jgi:hypothetical protein
MFRVTKKNKYFSIITYGSPEKRLGLFLETLKPYTYELSLHQVPLSLLSNFVNSLRNNSKDFSIGSALKDKNVLIDSFYEGKIFIKKNNKIFFIIILVCIAQLETKKQKILDGINPKNVDVNEISKKIKHLKIMKLIMKEKKRKEEKEKMEIEKEKEKEKENVDNDNNYNDFDNDNKDNENNQLMNINDDNCNNDKEKNEEFNLSKK